MGFETQEQAERYAEAAEFRADQLREERLLLTMQERIELLRAALVGVRGMAEAEVATGSKTWAKALVLIDQTLSVAS